MSAAGVSRARVLRSEWIKLTTLRSTKITFAAAAASMVALSIMLSWLSVHDWAGMTAAERTELEVEDVVLSGRLLAQLAIGAVGVMAITGEYATGMIRATLAAVPRRLPVLAAKLAVYAIPTLALMLVASFASFFAGNALLGAHWDFHLADPGVLRSVLGAAVSLTAVCLLGVALGFIVRNTAGAISVLFAILVGLPVFGGFAPEVGKFLPSGAMDSLTTAKIEAYMLAPAPALLVLCAYVVVAIAAAAVMLRRRDA